MVDAKGMAGLAQHVVVGQAVLLVGVARYLFHRAVGHAVDAGVAHGGHVHRPRPGDGIHQPPQLDHALGAKLQQPVAKLRVLEVVDVELFAPQFEGQVLHAGGVNVSHHLTVLSFEVVRLLQHLFHGRGALQVGQRELVAGVFRKIGRHGPGQGGLFKDDLATENGWQHHHAEGDQRPGLRIGLAQAHVAEALVKDLLLFEANLHPVVGPIIIVPPKGDAVVGFPPVGVKTNPKGYVFFVCHRISSFMAAGWGAKKIQPDL